MPGASHAMSASYRGQGGEAETDEEKRADLLKQIQERVSSDLAAFATKTELEQIRAEQAESFKVVSLESLRSLSDPNNGAMAILARQGLEIKRMQADMKEKMPEDMSVRGQCAAYLKKNADAIKSIKDGIQVPLPVFEIRAASSPMTPATVMPGGTTYINRFEIQATPNEVLRAEPTFWDYIKKGSTNAETYIWINKKGQSGGGAAGWIGPGVYKPAISFTVNTEISNAKKIAANEKMALELLQDIDGFTSWVETELRYAVMQKVNDTLMTATASSTVPAGIQTLSTTYNVLTGVSTTNPTFWDSIKAAVTQLRVLRFKGPIVAFVNPVDLANGVMTKAISQGQLFIPPATGASIVEDLNIPLGYIQVAAMDYFKILIYKPFSMSWGWENDDFTKNLITVIGEMRLHQFHSENYNGFAIYDTIANIESAITAV